MADNGTSGGKRVRVSQAEFPNNPIKNALRIANALWDNFAGKAAAPHDLAFAINMSPTSGPWRNLCGSSLAYGLTDGGYNASEISLTELGRRIVAPTAEGEAEQALVEAILKPRIEGEFFRRYDRAKFPKDEIAKNILVSLGLPKERTDSALETLKLNGQEARILLADKSGKFVALAGSQLRRVPEEDIADDLESNFGGPGRDTENDTKPVTQIAPAHRPDAGNRVFITHGANKRILDQIKEIVRFGKFEPVVAQEHETVSKPVPEKVMDDMRNSQAAVIHVHSEGALTDEDGKLFPKINGNVLIEIGAAMALYGRNFILLVEDGVKLPSNLQGLYECRYKGESLDGEATMKLLKAFNEFR